MQAEEKPKQQTENALLASARELAKKKKLNLTEAMVFVAAAAVKRNANRELIARDMPAIWDALLDAVEPAKVRQAVRAFSPKLANCSALNQRLASLELVERFKDSAEAEASDEWLE